MWSFAALLSSLVSYGACFLVVQSVRRRAPGLNAALAYAAFVFAEALLVHVLSAVHALGRVGLLTGNLVLAGAAWLLARSTRRENQRWPVLRVRVHPAHLPVLALGAMALVSALAYPPNNWDSMTYHLARVAHWLQHGSVARFATSNARQVIFPPGAEYLLVVLQGIARSDRLAGLVQWTAWIVTALAAAPLARSFGAPRWLAPFAAIIVAAGPLAIQEASSTQNDLVAGTCTVALIAALLPFLHRRRAWRSGDVVVSTVVVSAALIVKSTSLVVATPFAVWAIAAFLPALRRRQAWTQMGRASPALLVAAGVLLPYQYHWNVAAEGRQYVTPYVYLGVAEGGDRAVNVLRGFFRNLPLPLASLDRLAPKQTEGCQRRGSLCLEQNRQLTEDFTANVGQALVVLACLLVGAARWRHLPRRAGLALACLMGAWCLFHFVFRDNVWIPRLHLAFFAASPLALAAFAGRRTGPGKLVVPALVAALVLLAVVAAVRTPRRPLMTRPLRTAGKAANYYRGGPAGVAERQQAVLDWLTSSGCARLGLLLGGDSYDYPITWRAMQLGVEVRHLDTNGDWPCAVYSDRGAPPGRFRAHGETADPFLWTR